MMRKRASDLLKFSQKINFRAPSSAGDIGVLLMETADEISEEKRKKKGRTKLRVFLCSGSFCLRAVGD